ncbi:hypothetical protein A2291_06535 [candidate division WOR-1 bacterium RIFOXYB2_FULL_42_35]|uniref:Uncharacterized protein n=1 Tax=candidate division WOR-1 bacterium RIFOXYC2_FULL_41_25 TaxID=1802586 RepID=A0A1F4TRA4_UNCSA|nr:MAG: hypothetical protein A2291_06535 [candidate division WOR-1 bacterium RIFOXYB2_FULL_42_35]OGC24538.1 MAG: hypothetical protein A2247_06315 [candidate division WOR-1 bacterium RIFOXYA2_FULL_41_14]OGC34583.1 MAG: hypothetical protein A2462_04550 [candidate division WOR-1 bacterium RIFOXYC2_FULL_41_25]OGC43736.1 MAG: hypothetical protein A2548_05945 [candidate division WOR-1 bacterium RIFOXYD2_FULL_41_8]
MRLIAFVLILTLSCTPILAATTEATVPNFWQEADITFWQTLPFAIMWGYILERQASRVMFPDSDPHWNFIMSFSTVVSLGNAFLHASEVVKK